MNDSATPIAMWLADYFLLGAILLLLTLGAHALLKQPAQRLAITKSTLGALFLLALLCALPGWSIVHLLSARQPRLDDSLVTATRTEPIAAPSSIVRPSPENVTTAPPAPAIALPRAQFWSTLSRTAVLVLMYAFGSACGLAWLAIGSLSAHRLVRTATPAPAHLSNLIADLTNKHRKNVRLLLSPQLDVAVAIGIRHPAILLPESLATTHSALPTPPSPLATILAHELAHITNHDLHWLAASRALLVLLWPQPLFWLLRRHMRLDQEALADADAAELTSRQTYAEQLVAWARQLPAHPAPRLSLAVGLWESPSQLRQRIALLVNDQFTVLRNCSRRWRLIATSLAIMSAMALSFVTLEPNYRTSAQDLPPAKVDNSTQPVANPEAAKSRANAPNEPVDIPIIVARHVLLHDGKIIEWADIEKMVAALPNPKLARPGFYFTRGSLPEREEEIRTKIWEFRRRQPMAGHTWASVQARTSPHYDAIRTAADLVPNPAWRVAGTVETVDGLPIDRAEVVLATPVDGSLQNPHLGIYLHNGRLRQPLDEVVTASDNSGRFAVYPPPNTPYYLIALHKEGFGMARSDEFEKTGHIQIAPWARARGYVKQSSNQKRMVTVQFEIPATEGWPALGLYLGKVDVSPPPLDPNFDFKFVPPRLKGVFVDAFYQTSDAAPGFISTGPASLRNFTLQSGETFNYESPPNVDTIEIFTESPRQRAD